MRFQHFDALRVFSVVAENSSFSAAAEVLNLTKGAVSYQIKQLEEDLGFMLFDSDDSDIAEWKQWIAEMLKD